MTTSRCPAVPVEPREPFNYWRGPEQYDCECATRAKPYFDPACPQHGAQSGLTKVEAAFARGLRNAVAARGWRR